MIDTFNTQISNELSFSVWRLKNIFAVPFCLRTAHVLEVDNFMLEAHVHSPQETSAKPLRGVCWHFFDILIYEYRETQFLPLPVFLLRVRTLSLRALQNKNNTSNFRSGS